MGCVLEREREKGQMGCVLEREREKGQMGCVLERERERRGRWGVSYKERGQRCVLERERRQMGVCPINKRGKGADGRVLPCSMVYLANLLMTFVYKLTFSPDFPEMS